VITGEALPRVAETYAGRANNIPPFNKKADLVAARPQDTEEQMYPLNREFIESQTIFFSSSSN
jgi:hypothetical protein